MNGRRELSVPNRDVLLADFNNAVNLADNIVLKNYLAELSDLDIVPLDSQIEKSNILSSIQMFKITEIVYEKNEFAAYKFASVFNALSNYRCSIFLIIDSDGMKTDFYMGVHQLDESQSVRPVREILENSLKGQFPGIKTENCLEDKIEDLIQQIDDNADNIAAVSCVANNKLNDNQENKSFIQGLEKLVLAMQGQKYTGIILANSTKQSDIINIRKGYEEIYTKLMPFAKQQISYSSNYSISHTDSTADSQSYSDATSSSHTYGHSSGRSTSLGNSESTNRTKKTSILGNSAVSTVARVAASVSKKAPFLISMLANALDDGSEGVSQSTSRTNSSSSSSSWNDTTGSSHTNTTGRTTTTSRGNTEGNGVNKTVTVENKQISNLLEKLDLQMKRLKEFESLGMWECAAYFMSKDTYAAETAASTYKALMSGRNTGIEYAVINSWKQAQSSWNIKKLKDYILNMMHPVFEYNTMDITPCSYISGNELAIHMGLPRKSVCGFPVIEHVDFGKEVVNYEHKTPEWPLNIGKVFNMGIEMPNDVVMDGNSLSMHTFITGATGSGKSNTVYELLQQLSNHNKVNYLVIEPAKGEYKHIFGKEKNVHVFGTNPSFTDILRINPFRFPKGVFAFEHIDRLVEIFNVCWPMYAAMPAILKDAILKAYEDCGWKMDDVKAVSDKYPCFKDVEKQLKNVIDESEYADEIKSNYKGSLLTRIHSLTNGLNGLIFTDDEIDSSVLFDENVIIDLSCVGSSETKSLIMGVLVMRLNEHRMVSAKGMNQPLKHVTVLEEAHNILKNTAKEHSPEGVSLAGKSVEMLANAIAEMRTYGEGFIIADQSPSTVDMAAIRNTNTKIIMRLPDEADRRMAGKSAALKDEQLDEIAKLPKGVAVVYQNDWLEPVLCKIRKFNEPVQPIKKEEIKSDLKKDEPKTAKQSTVKVQNKTVESKDDDFKGNLLRLLLKNELPGNTDINIGKIYMDLLDADLPAKDAEFIDGLLGEYENNHTLSIWQEDNRDKLMDLLIDVLGLNKLDDSYKNNINEYVQYMDKYITDIICSNFDNVSSRKLHDVKEGLVNRLSNRLFGDSEKSDDFYRAWLECARRNRK